MLLHDATVTGLLDSICLFFKPCAQFSVRLHPKNCRLFGTSTHWCVKIVLAEGVRHDSRQLNGLLNMEPSTNGGQLQQFRCAVQWLKTGITDFSSLIYIS